MGTTLTLGTWYADPRSPEEARALLAKSEAREAKRTRHGGNTLTCRLQALIAHYWLGGDTHQHYLMLMPAAARSAHGKALLEMVYGQLLLSRRLTQGLMHLDAGFRLAANLFAAGDYLEVMNRHRLLRQLPLSTKGTEAEPLETLLTSAKVIERMRQNETGRQPFDHDPKDTYG